MAEVKRIKIDNNFFQEIYRTPDGKLSEVRTYSAKGTLLKMDDYVGQKGSEFICCSTYYNEKGFPTFQISFKGKTRSDLHIIDNVIVYGDKRDENGQTMRLFSDQFENGHLKETMFYKEGKPCQKTTQSPTVVTEVYSVAIEDEEEEDPYF